ncbi:MAG: cell division protein FtsQ/DivIB [Thermoleophilia bacterium]
MRRLTVVLLAVSAAALVLGFYWLRSSDVFAVRQASFTVAEHVTEAEMRAVVDPVSGVNLLQFSTKALEAELHKIPYVRSARVYRRFPHGLEIDIEEYVAVARVRDSQGVDWLLADDGMVLAEAGASSHGLPVVVPEADTSPQAGVPTAPQVAAAIPLAVMVDEGTAWPASLHPVKQVSVLRTGESTLVLEGGGEIRLGDPAQLDEKLTVALEIIDRYSKDGKRLDYVDVRVPTRVVAKAR